ncbi:hypothetical protein SGLAM104S_00004 [Streptomyces glaucescens]
MNDDTDKRRFHPSEWGGKEKELVWLPEGLHDEHRAWLAWFGNILCRVGFTSFGQACNEALPKTDESGSRPQLQMSQRTLTNWIKAEKLPHDKTFLDTMQYLNERIKERRRSHPDALARSPTARWPKGCGCCRPRGVPGTHVDTRPSARLKRCSANSTRSSTSSTRCVRPSTV